MDKRQQGFILDRPLNIEGREDIGMRIMETEAKLMKLLALRQAGKTTVRMRRRLAEIEGIPIRYAQNGGNKLIAYESELSEDIKVFREKVGRIFRVLANNGYKPTLCKEIAKVEVSSGKRCLI